MENWVKVLDDRQQIKNNEPEGNMKRLKDNNITKWPVKRPQRTDAFIAKTHYCHSYHHHH